MPIYIVISLCPAPKFWCLPIPSSAQPNQPYRPPPPSPLPHPHLLSRSLLYCTHDGYFFVGRRQPFIESIKRIVLVCFHCGYVKLLRETDRKNGTITVSIFSGKHQTICELTSYYIENKNKKPQQQSTAHGIQTRIEWGKGTMVVVRSPQFILHCTIISVNTKCGYTLNVCTVCSYRHRMWYCHVSGDTKFNVVQQAQLHIGRI